MCPLLTQMEPRVCTCNLGCCTRPTLLRPGSEWAAAQGLGGPGLRGLSVPRRRGRILCRERHKDPGQDPPLMWDPPKELGKPPNTRHCPLPSIPRNPLTFCPGGPSFPIPPGGPCGPCGKKRSNRAQPWQSTEGRNQMEKRVGGTLTLAPEGPAGPRGPGGPGGPCKKIRMSVHISHGYLIPTRAG